MALLFRLHNRQLLKYVTANKSWVLMARPVTMKAQPAPSIKQEGYDERNMKIGRPMSPHLTIYKPQLTAMLSITHRGMGMGLGFYLACLSAVAVWSSHDISYYLSNLEDIGGFTHFVLKMFIAVPFCYHYCNGIRHLCWDMGKLLSIKQVYSSGYLMFAVAMAGAVGLSLL